MYREYFNESIKKILNAINEGCGTKIDSLVPICLKDKWAKKLKK